jgi:hypothetical protein
MMNWMLTEKQWMTSLSERLDQWTSDQLKEYVQLLGGNTSITRKGDRIAFICQQMLNRDSLARLWEQLDQVSQRAVSAAYHNGGEFNIAAFVNQYGVLPPRPEQKNRYWGYLYQTPILFDLFVDRRHLLIAQDLMPLLEDLVLPVERFELKGVKTVPKFVELEDYSSPVITVETELIGRTDLLTYLRMVELGHVKLSTTSHRLTAASVRKVADNLLNGDYRPLPEKVTGRTTIRPSGLDVFTQESGLVSRSGTLTRTGKEYSKTRNPEILLTAFEKWSESNGFDELQRITHLSGVGSKKTRLTASGFRRERVIEALSWCPVDTWISINDFYRAFIIWDFDFEVEETGYSNLYVGSPYYGSLSGTAYWGVAKGLYISAIIWEYLATLGAVDIAFAEDEYFTVIETGNLYIDEPISQYDSLLYFRINSWGAFLLGQAGDYMPGEPEEKNLFRIDDDQRVHLLADCPPAERLQLEVLAEQLDEQTYQLDTVKVLTAVEGGQSLEQISAFLKTNHPGDLPSSVADWLAMFQRNQGAFREDGGAVLIHLKQPGLKELVTNDTSLSKICRILDNKTILIRQSQMTRFRNRLKELGYLLR